MTQELPAWTKNFTVDESDFAEESLSFSRSKDSEEFAKLLDEQSSSIFEEGQVYKGKVVQIRDGFVVVDIGYKQEGVIPVKECLNSDGQIGTAVGEQLEVFLEKLESSSGKLILSRDKVEVLKAWDKISEACEQEKSVEGVVIAKTKGGLLVDIGVRAFLPGSQIDIKQVKNLNKYIGQKMMFRVFKFNKKRGNIVLSRRAIVSDERKKQREETLSRIQEGMKVSGTVKNITEYGVFLDIGGVDGLLHITDISWGRVKHPNQIFNLGDEVEVKVIKLDAEKGRVSLGLKQMTNNPWDNVDGKYPIGKKILGKIVSMRDYGFFVELSEGLEGLVHFSELSWTERPAVVLKNYNEGQEIEAVVLEVDMENKRISLGVRQLQKSPWEDLGKKYSTGDRVKGKIKTIVEFGLFVDINEKVDALVHISDVSWSKKNIVLKDEFREGDEIDAVVLVVDKNAQKFSLGIKQLTQDPWMVALESVKVGDTVEGEIIKIVDFGLFIALDHNVDGFVHISEVSNQKIDDIRKVKNVGDRIKALVIGVDEQLKKISLSIKQVGRKIMSSSNKEQSLKAGDISKYTQEAPPDALGSIIKDKDKK